MPRRLRRSTGRPPSIAELVRSVTFPAGRSLASGSAIPGVETGKRRVRVDQELPGLEIDPRVLVRAGEPSSAGERLDDGDRRLGRAVGPPQPEGALVDGEVERRVV